MDNWLRGFPPPTKVVALVLAAMLVMTACANTSPITSSSADDTAQPAADAAADAADSEDANGAAAEEEAPEDAADESQNESAPAGEAEEVDPNDLPAEARVFGEYGPIDLAGMSVGLESCAGVDPAPYSELLGIDVIVDADENLANVEPSSPDRTCVLYAADDADVDLIRINAIDDGETFAPWLVHNAQLEDADVDLFQAADDTGTYEFGDTADLGYATLNVESEGSRLVIEGRQWDFGVEFRPVEIQTLAAMATIAAQQLTSPGPGPATSVLESCDDLDRAAWSELVGDELQPWIASSFNGSLTCTATTRDGARVQALVAEAESGQDALTRTDLLRSAYETSLRTPDRLTLEGVESAWEIDRIFDDDASQTEQSVLQASFGNEGPIFARVSVRQDTRGERASVEMIGRALAAVLTGEEFLPNDPDAESGPVFRLPQTDAAKQFVESGARIEVAPLTRGLAACSEIDLEPFETITGKELVAVTGIVQANLNPSLENPANDSEGELNGGAAPAVGERIVECSLVREDDPSIVEMRVSAATTADATNDWTNADLITGLVLIDGIDDAAFWNEGEGNTGDRSTSTGAGLVLYIEESDARLLVEMVKYPTTPNIDVFWIAQAFARELFAPSSE